MKSQENSMARMAGNPRKLRKAIKIVLLTLLALFGVLIIAGIIAYQSYATKMKSMSLDERLQYTLDQVTDETKIHGTVFQVYRSSDKFEWSGASGNMNTDSPYSIASVTKMYTATAIMKLIEAGQIGLDDPVSEYLPAEMVEGLHIYEGKDYSQQLTIRHLLSHQSGLPDYFTESTEDNPSIAEERQANHDVSYDIYDVLSRTKTLSPHFVPESEGEAYYSDGNYQLLGFIIEKVTNKPLANVYKEYIFDPLELAETYLKVDSTIWGISSIYNEKTEIQVPAIVASERSAGGIVSTVNDNMIFLRAFFSGDLFPKKYLEQMEQWNKIFFPMEYGMGIMKCNIPGGFLDLSDYELIGHSGSTGSVCYYCPARDLYIVGTTQQLDTVKATLTAYRVLLCFNFE